MKWKDKYPLWRRVELHGQAILILSKKFSLFLSILSKACLSFLFVVFHKNDTENY